MKGFVFCLCAVIIYEPFAVLMTYFLGKKCFRKVIIQTVSSRIHLYEAIDRGFLIHGVKLSLLLRLHPVIPSNILNYFLSVTSCTPWSVYVGTLIGIVPDSLLMIFIGINIQGASNIFESRLPALGELKKSLLVIPLAVFFVSIMLITNESKKQLMRLLEDDH